MTQPLTINIADFVVSVACNDPAMMARFRQRYCDFLAPSTPSPDIAIQCHVIPNAQFIEATPGSLWVSNVAVADGKLTYESYLERGALDLTTCVATIEMAPHAEIENFLRVVYAWLCIEHGSLLLHGAGVVKDECGYVFFGPSGAGKSTTAGLSAEIAHVLSDDIVIIRQQADGYYLCGVPFLGEMVDAPRQNMSAPLKGIYRLHQDMMHRITPLPHVLAVAELVASAPFIVQHSALGDQLIAVCNSLNKTIPVQKLHFNETLVFGQLYDELRKHLS